MYVCIFSEVLKILRVVAGYVLLAMCVCVCVWTRVFAASEVVIVGSPDANHAVSRVQTYMYMYIARY